MTLPELQKQSEELLLEAIDVIDESIIKAKVCKVRAKQALAAIKKEEECIDRMIASMKKIQIK